MYKLIRKASIQNAILASLIWSEAYLDGLTGKALENKVKTELAKDGITEDKYEIIVTDKGVTINKK